MLGKSVVTIVCFFWAVNKASAILKTCRWYSTVSQFTFKFFNMKISSIIYKLKTLQDGKVKERVHNGAHIKPQVRFFRQFAVHRSQPSLTRIGNCVVWVAGRLTAFQSSGVLTNPRSVHITIHCGILERCQVGVSVSRPSLESPVGLGMSFKPKETYDGDQMTIASRVAYSPSWIDVWWRTQIWDITINALQSTIISLSALSHPAPQMTPPTRGPQHSCIRSWTFNLWRFI